MRVLFVTMQLGRSYAQGTERYVSSLGDGLSERGHEVSYLAGDPLGLDRLRALGERVNADRRIYHYPSRGWMAVAGIEPDRLERWLTQHRPDLVHVNSPAHVGAGVMVACRRLGIPVVVTVHDYWWICPKATLLREGNICDGTPDWRECIRCIASEHHRPVARRLARLPRATAPLTVALYAGRAVLGGASPADALRWPRRRAFLVRMLEQADHLIFPSRAMADVMAPRLTHGRWQVTPNGLEPRWFIAPRRPPARPLPPESFTIGFAGALAPHKAPHLLLQAVRRLGWTRTRIRLAGPAADRIYSQRLREESAGLNVDFAGAVATDRMPDYLRSLDVFAMTSTWPENFPYVVLEAQAAGVPVVGSRAGGVVEQVGDDRRLFEPGSVAQLADALAFVRAHPQAAQPDKVPTLDGMADATEGAYRAAAARREG